MGKNYECLECGYAWTSKKIIGSPSFCPSCKSDEIDEIEQQEEKDDNDELNDVTNSVSYSTLLNINKSKMNDFMTTYYELLCARDKEASYKIKNNQIIGKSHEVTFLAKRPILSYLADFKVIKNKVNLHIKVDINTGWRVFTKENRDIWTQTVKEYINDTYKILNKKTIIENVIHCVECGQELKHKFKFCPKCGKKQ